MNVTARGGGGGIWPAADFDDWPDTRVFALVFDGVVALVVIAALAVPRIRSWCLRLRDSRRCCRMCAFPVLAGCLAGLWLHFVPCIWWTCDWGPHDGEGVRGGIWFVTWGAVTAWLCYSGAARGKRSPERAHDDTSRTERAPLETAA